MGAGIEAGAVAGWALLLYWALVGGAMVHGNNAATRFAQKNPSVFAVLVVFAPLIAALGGVLLRGE